MKFALNEECLTDTLVMLTVSMASPWSILDQLQFWAGVLHDHIDSLKLSPDKVKDLRSRCVQRWLDYVEPGDEMDLAAAGKQSSRNSKNLEDEPSLPSNTLVRNTGVEIIVVVTKVNEINYDTYSPLDRFRLFKNV